MLEKLLKELRIQPFYRKSSFTVKQLSEELLSEKDKKENNKKLKSQNIKLIIISYLIVTILGLLSYKFMLPNFKGNHIFLILQISLVVGFCYLIIPNIFKLKFTDGYDAVRREIKKYLLTNVCNCERNNKCNCNDELVKWMFDKGIDLVKEVK